jgi:hypothetical protein
MKNSMTFEQHVRLGNELKEVREVLMSAQILVANSGHRDARSTKTAKFLERSLDQLDKARSEAEEIMFRDHPAEATTGIYYGSR